MDTTLAYFIDYADAEFDGESFNGDSLIKTLRKLSPEVAAGRGTWEGYSVWSVAIHLAWFKYFFARSLLGEAAVGAFPYEHDEHGFGAPATATPMAWAETLEYLARVHRLAAGAIRDTGPERLAATMDEWEMPYGQAIAWLLGHDTCHIAQIRNMGVPGLKE
jgi:hypothetical protein